MRISEITDSYLAEAPPGILDRAMKFGADFVNPGRNLTPADWQEYLPDDGTREYYKDREYYYRAKSGKWVDEETGKNANMFTHAALMDKYGFEPTREPKRRLLQKILRDKQRTEDERLRFDNDAIVQIDKVFASAKKNFQNLGNLNSYFTNALKLHDYHSKGFNLKDLDTRIDKNNFNIGSPPAVSSLDVDTIGELYKSTIVAPDLAKLKQLKTDYDTRMGGAGPSATPTAFKTLPPDSDLRVKELITKYITDKKASDVAKLPQQIEGLKKRGYETTPYVNLVATELRKVIDAADTISEYTDMNALFDMIIRLKPLLPTTSASTKTKLNALDLDTLFSGTTVTPAQINALKTKRATAVST